MLQPTHLVIPALLLLLFPPVAYRQTAHTVVLLASSELRYSLRNSMGQSMYIRMQTLPTSSHTQKAKMRFIKALIVDVMHLATWSVVCTGSTDAGGTVHSKECPLLFAILMYLLTSGLPSLLAV